MTDENPYTNTIVSTTASSLICNTRKRHQWMKSIKFGKIVPILFLILIAYSHMSFFSNVIIPHNDHHPHQVPIEFFMEQPSNNNNKNQQKQVKLPKRRKIKDKLFRRNKNKNKNKNKNNKNKNNKNPIIKETPVNYANTTTTKIKPLPSSALKTKEEEEINEDECSYIHKNALESTAFPACNIVHEVSMTQNDFAYLTEGTARATFLAQDASNSTIVFKISRWSRTDFSPYGLGKNRKDGMTLEALSSSDYIIKIFGYCGSSQILELGDGGNVHDLIQRSRDHKVNLSYVDRLKVSIQLATSIADLHEYAHASHRDVCCHQFVNVNGVYKLNDFHLAKYTQHIPRTKQLCALSNANTYPKIHAPEEYYGRSIGNYNIDGEKADVYMLGNIMYNVLTNKWTFENYNRKEATKRMIKGLVPDIPSVILAKNETNVAVNVLLKGIHMCWTSSVRRRPTARSVAQFLRSELAKILGKEQIPSIIQVDVPPLEKDYSYSDRGFYKYLYREDNVDIDHSEF